MRYLIAVLVVSLSSCGPDLEVSIGEGRGTWCGGHVTSCFRNDAGHVECVDAGYRTYPEADGGTSCTGTR